MPNELRSLAEAYDYEGLVYLLEEVAAHTIEDPELRDAVLLAQSGIPELESMLDDELNRMYTEELEEEDDA